MTSIDRARHSEINAAMDDLSLAYAEIGHDAMFEMLSGPCGYAPGSAYKIAVKTWRRMLGVSLDIAGDATALEARFSRGERLERQHLPLPQGGGKG